MAAPVSARPLATLGKYELVAKLAEGGMGSVFKARHRETGEVVALKVASLQLTANSVQFKRFEQEFKAASYLHHPNIVRGLEFCQDGPNRFLVMEYVEGVSLGHRIETKGRLPEVEAIQLIAQIAQGLQVAHINGLIHRDIKPDNILITEAGEAKLTDLGLVKDVDHGADLTRPLTGLGTPNFMAPEQFDNAKNVDHRCDIYSLGATLYMAVTAELPFRARGPLSTLRKKLENTLTAPRQLVKSLSESTDRAIRKALSLDPAQRQQSCLEFVDDLTQSGSRRTAEPRPEVQEPPPVTRKSRGVELRATVRFASRREGFCRPLGGEGRHRWRGKINDISASGLGLLVGRRFEPHTVLAVEVDGGDPEIPSQLFVRVVRVQARPRGKWLVGCSFASRLSEDEVHSLSDLPDASSSCR